MAESEPEARGEETDNKNVNTESTQNDKIELTKIADYTDAKLTLAHYAGICLWLGWFAFYAYLPMFVILLWVYWKTGLSFLLGFLLIAHFAPIKRQLQPKWCFELGAFLMRKAAEYFRLRVYCEDHKAVNESGPAVWSIEPHDVLPLGLFSYSDYLGSFPGHRMMGCLTSACFLIPGMKHVYVWASATSVDKKTLVKLLQKGISPTICPGGAAEVAYLRNNRETVMYLKSRLGLVRLAMQFGVPIIPTVAYNQRDAFTFWVPKSTFLHNLGRKVGFIPIVILGLFNIPFAQPKPRALQVVVGRPIPIPKVEGKPTEEQLHKYHDVFVEATRKLYEDHKAQFGMGDVTLKII